MNEVFRNLKIHEIFYSDCDSIYMLKSAYDRMLKDENLKKMIGKDLM